MKGDNQNLVFVLNCSQCTYNIHCILYYNKNNKIKFVINNIRIWQLCKYSIKLFVPTKRYTREIHLRYWSLLQPMASQYFRSQPPVFKQPASLFVPKTLPQQQLTRNAYSSETAVLRKNSQQSHRRLLSKNLSKYLRRNNNNNNNNTKSFICMTIKELQYCKSY